MKFIKLFEDHTGVYQLLSDSEVIEKYWMVDPLEFKDIIISSLSQADIWGSVSVAFSFLYPTPSDDAENNPIFYVGMDDDNDGINRAPYYNNLDVIIDTKKYLPVIEAWVQTDKSDQSKLKSFMKIQNSRMYHAKIPYKMDWPDGYNHTPRTYTNTYLEFKPTIEF